MVFLYTITGLILILALFSLSSYLPYYFVGLLCIFAITGLGLSWWQQKVDRKIPHLKTLVYAALVILFIQVSFHFFNKSSDILLNLITTWSCFLVLSAFIIYSKRDYYVIQALSLGLVVFSCFSGIEIAAIPLGYILGFFIIWIIGLRLMNLLLENREAKFLTQKKGWIFREFKIWAALICLVIFLALPLYVLLPRFEQTLPFISVILAKRYSTSYIDYPGKSMRSFFAPSEQTLGKLPGEDEGHFESPRESPEKMFGWDGEPAKETFQHSAPGKYEGELEELQEQVKRLNQVIKRAEEQIARINQENSLPEIKQSIAERQRLENLKKSLSERRAELEKKQEALQQEYLKKVNEKSAISLNRPENKALLKTLDSEIRAAEEDLQAKIDNLRQINEALKRIEAEIVEIHKQWDKTKTGRELNRLWSEKGASQEKIVPLENKINLLQSEFIRFKNWLKKNKAERPKIEQGKEAARRRFSILNLLGSFFILILLSVALYLVGQIAWLFFMHLREKRKIDLTFKENCRLFIILTYN
ncbi:transglutaminaseTgpA domain-containing protein, partial [Candidatus Omnitrophota bacterium]